MDNWQVARQIKKIIEAITWDDGEKLVRQADISPLPVDGVVELRFTPCAIIVIGSSTVTPHRQEEVSQDFEIVIAHEVYGDQVVTASIIGKDRGTGAGGRGILEAEKKLLTNISLLTEQNGIRFLFLGAGATNINYIGDGDGNIVSRTYRFQCRCTQQRTYESPTRLRYTGNVSLTWSLPGGTRFDLAKIVLRRSSAGGSAPQTVSEGTGVTLASDLATSVSDGPLGSGTYWYSVFAQYDDNNTGLSANYNASPPYSWKVTV